MTQPVPSAHDYTQPAEVIVYADADGNVTEDPDRAVRGEIIVTLPGGGVESTLFTL